MPLKAGQWFYVNQLLPNLLELPKCQISNQGWLTHAQGVADGLAAVKSQV